MESNSLLVKIPSSPFHLNVLRPDTYLATLAGHLIANGHRTTIWDFGTLEMFERLFPQMLHKEAIERVERQYLEQARPNYLTLWSQWKKGRRSCEIQRHQNNVWKEIAQKIIHQKSIDFVLLNIDCESDRAVCEQIIPLIRHARPNLTLVGAGNLFRQNRDGLPSFVPLFDCIYWGNSGESLVEWVNERENRGTWNQIPYLAYSDSVRMYITDSARKRDSSDEILPDYSESVYPALHDFTKILYFDVEEVLTENESDALCIKSPEIIVGEIKTIIKQFKTLAFHFMGSSPDSGHAELLAQEILARHLNIRYTRECHVGSTPPSTISALSASGCSGIDFKVDTGSQRLLNKYYGHSFGVSQVEQTIRASTFSNLFTVMNFSYPCVEDDYHTRAETLRLIQRSKPHGTSVSIPPQEHRRTTDLKSRFETKSKLRSISEIRNEYDSLCQEIEQFGVSTQTSPLLAFMADLSGYRGHEEEYLQRITYQFMTGDVSGIEAAIGRINQATRQVNNTIAFTPFKRLQHVVGN